MPEATDDHTTPNGDRGRTDAQQPETAEATDAVSQWPLGDIEPELRELHSAASLLAHVASSPYEVLEDQILFIKGRIVAHLDRIEDLWTQATDEQQHKREEHEAALAAAKARTAPGSKDEVQYVAGLWGLLAGAARVVLERAREATPEGTRALAGDAKATPPAESGRA